MWFLAVMLLAQAVPEGVLKGSSSWTAARPTSLTCAEARERISHPHQNPLCPQRQSRYRMPSHCDPYARYVSAKSFQSKFCVSEDAPTAFELVNDRHLKFEQQPDPHEDFVECDCTSLP